jgi:ArsR family transcriptional regulator, virulence genes transcriptional regulator
MKANELNRLIPKALEAAETLKALAHETRLLAVCFIGEGEKSVQEMEEFLGTTQSNVSQHLARLKSAGILQSRRQGKQVFYGAASREIFSLVKTLQQIYCPAPERPKGKERIAK